MKKVVRGVAAWQKMRRFLRQEGGFTIIETMIVLAVTGGLFVAIAATLSGRQNSAEFQHAIQNTQARIQQTIDQVSAGFYPNNSDFTCKNAGNKVQINGGSNTQGTNDECVFLGKVIQFGVHGTNPEQNQTYTIAGLRCDSVTGVGCAAAGAASPFSNTNPTVLGYGGNYTSFSTLGTLEYGLTTLWMRTGATNIGAVGFLMEPGSLNAASMSGVSAGKQQVDLIPLPGSSLGQTVNASVSSIETELNKANLTANAPINPANGVQICFLSGGTNQSGLVTIGGSGRQLTVTLLIKGNTTCS